jgi:DsbC/DsbD-like thiol-disulfide interchange protein
MTRRLTSIIRDSGTVLTFFLVGFLGVTGTDPATADEPALQSGWIDGHNSRTRLTAGHTAGGTPEVYAFVEIELGPGWKTYWRNPGESGIPPRFDFKRSKNIAKAEVLYPAPTRIADPVGDIVGYKGRVIFPVKLTLTDAAQATDVAADVQFGICKDICVPSEAALDVMIPAGDSSPIGDTNDLALSRVPRDGSSVTGKHPNTSSVVVDLKSTKPRLEITGYFPGGTQNADVFVEAPDGIYLPLLVKTAEVGNEASFEADLSKDVDLKALAGKTLTITVVSDTGASQSTFKIDSKL